MKPPEINTSEVIKNIRSELGMTQNEFATAMNISRSAVTQLENGNTKPSFALMTTLVEDFGIDMNVFFNNDAKVGEKQKVTEKEIERKVKKIESFHSRYYGMSYNALLYDKLIESVASSYSNKEEGKALIGLYKIYQFVRAYTDMFEADILDPLKRHIHTVRQMRKEKGDRKEFQDEELREKFNSAQLQLGRIMKNAYHFNEHYGDIFNKFLEDNQDILRSEYVMSDTRLQKMMLASQERYLREFIFLIRYADDLDQLEEYYKVEHLWEE